MSLEEMSLKLQKLHEARHQLMRDLDNKKIIKRTFNEKMLLLDNQVKILSDEYAKEKAALNNKLMKTYEKSYSKYEKVYNKLDGRRRRKK